MTSNNLSIARYISYIKIGLGNYVALWISLFTTSSLIWKLTPIHEWISLSKFILVFISIYLPIAVYIGKRDFEKGIAKTLVELHPYWRRATWHEQKIAIGTIFGWGPLLPQPSINSISKDLNKCLKEALEEHIRWIVSEGKYTPKSTCICKLLYDQRIIDEVHLKKCIEIANRKK